LGNVLLALAGPAARNMASPNAAVAIYAFMRNPPLCLLRRGLQPDSKYRSRTVFPVLAVFEIKWRRTGRFSRDAADHVTRASHAGPAADTSCRPALRRTPHTRHRHCARAPRRDNA